MRLRTLVAPLAAVALAACAQSPQAAPSPSPTPAPSTAGPTPAPAPAPTPTPTPAPAPAPSAAGAYDFSTTVQGQQVTGTITIVDEGGRLGGTIVTSATPELAIKAVMVNGNVITVTGDTPDGEVAMEMTMNGADFTGTWSYGGQSGSMSGRKRG